MNKKLTVQKSTGRPPRPNFKSRRLPPGVPNPIDVHVGGRVRLRRTLLGMSQEKLGEAVNLTFQQILGWLFMPVAWIIGVPWAEAAEAGSFIGQKIVLNEFVAYLDFAPHIPELSGGTVVIVTFGLAAE